MASTDLRGNKEAADPDPRPKTVRQGDDYFVKGLICSACGYPSAVQVPWCPRCRAAMVEKLFGPRGKVWSATVVRIPLPNREPPYALAYVDLDKGPRVLAHVLPNNERLPVGRTVRLTSATAGGDVQVTAS